MNILRTAAFVLLAAFLTSTGFAQTPVTATSGLTFLASTNDGTNPDGTPVVGGYRVDFQPAAGCPAYTSAFLGKPTPVNGMITVQPFAPFAALPANCAYTISVTAVGQGPASATSVLSDTFERFVAAPTTCSDSAATNSGGPLPCVYQQSSGQGLPVTRDDVSCTEVIRSPNFGQGSNSAWYPMHFYYRDDGTLWYMQMTGDGHLVDFPAIHGVPCDTDLALIPQAPYGNDYGTLDDIHSSTDQVPSKTSNAMYAGIHVDQNASPKRVTVSTVGIYTNPYKENNFFTFEFNPATATKTLKACWFVEGKSMTLTGGGMVKPPDYFQKNVLGPGDWISAGNGGPNGGVPAGISMGMVGFAVKVPPDNPCHAFTSDELAARTPEQKAAGIVAVDYPVTPGPTLVLHTPNVNGPSCTSHPPLFTDGGIGCTPPKAPTLPYPQRTANITTSFSVYDETWVPARYPDGKVYGAIGPVSSGASWDWFKSRRRETAISAYASTGGWMNTQVAASPAPTYVMDGSNFSSGSGTLTLVDGCMHQGDCATSHPYPGFTLFVMTAAPGGDDVNMRNWGCAMVDSYNVTTRVMTFHWDSFCGPPMGANPMVPLVPGNVVCCAVYAHGMPGPSNFDNRVQFINPAQFAQVVQGTLDPSEPLFYEDFPLAPYMPQLGCTTCGHGGTIYTPVSNPMADGAHDQYMIPALAMQPGIYAESKLIYRFSVRP